MKRLRGSSASAIGWFRSYGSLWAVVLVGLLISWPGWYGDVLLVGIMTNVFSAFLMAPVAVFGFDRVIRHVEEVRERPRRLIARQELAEVLAGCVRSLAAIQSIETMLPGFIEKAAAGYPDASRVSEDNARYLSDLVVTEAIARRAEIERRLSALPLTDLNKIMRSLSDSQDELRERLVDAGDAVEPEEYAEVMALIHAIGYVKGNVSLAEYIEKTHVDMQRPQGVLLRRSFERQYISAVFDAADIYGPWSKKK